MPEKDRSAAPSAAGRGLDYGRPLEFALWLVPEAAAASSAIALARAADESGLDLIGIQDHPYQRRFLDTFVLIAHLFATTERIRIFPDVANLPLRSPAIIAKQAASLDVLSGGRFELGLGAGAFWDAVEAMGGPRRAPRDAVDALEEAIALIRTSWTADSVRMTGRHYEAKGYRPGPPPVHPIGIWLGAYGPRMLRLVGSVGDGWVPSLGMIDADGIARGNRVIDEAALAADREPRDIRRLLNLGASARSDTSADPGGPDEWVPFLASLATEHGVDTFVVGLSDPGAVRRFARSVIPAARDEVARRRAGRGG